MINSPIRIGSRGSQLALWQADYVAAQLRALGHAVEIEVIRTTGDRLQTLEGAADLTSPGGSAPNGTGIFIKEIEDALLAHRIDLAVHSLKDLPTLPTPGLTVAAIPPRADARDAFICEEHWGLHMLPGGSRIATTSPRRQAMLLALRPDLTFVEMRGNIDTRLRKWSEGQADALVLACAGLDRLGRTENVHQRFAIDELTPAPGQGALALQTRCPSSSFVIPEGNLRLASDGDALKGAGLGPSGGSRGIHAPENASAREGALAPEATALHSSAKDQVPQGFSLGSHGAQEKEGVLTPGDPARDAAIHTILRTLNDPTTEYAVTAERAVLNALGGGCQLPLGAYCHQVDDHWHLHAMVVSPDGDTVAQVLQKAPLGTTADELGAAVAEELIARGALELLRGVILEEV